MKKNKIKFTFLINKPKVRKKITKPTVAFKNKMRYYRKLKHKKKVDE